MLEAHLWTQAGLRNSDVVKILNYQKLEAHTEFGTQIISFPTCMYISIVYANIMHI